MLQLSTLFPMVIKMKETLVLSLLVVISLFSPGAEMIGRTLGLFYVLKQSRVHTGNKYRNGEFKWIDTIVWCGKRDDGRGNYGELNSTWNVDAGQIMEMEYNYAKQWLSK